MSNLAEELLLIFFQAAGDVTEQNVSEWVNSERFEAFVHASRSNFNDIAETGKHYRYTCRLTKKFKSR